MVSTVIVDLLASVGAPLKCLSEVRAVSGANSLTLGNLAGAALEFVDREISEQPSTSWGTDIFDGFINMQEEMLDYEDEQDVEEGDFVSKNLGYKATEKIGLVSNQERSICVLQKAVPKMVQ
ncbi:hypothetical protein NDU88_000665 [Pleurodeles waltl]|uniref:Uncharacterized protein n=1 Tax=Pleurodeles waltl TaxID=8319 RepID=A0AAV7S7V7_PLEWA|nr:hypothetical protein NDU88_000665 [Pleurodeles waltl]